MISTGNAPTEVTVYWGTNDGGTVESAWLNTNAFGVNGSATPASYTLCTNGLIPGQRYFYRYRASNATGVAWAPFSETFVTRGLPFVDNSIGATNIGVATAIINGRFLDDNRGRVTFYWGLTDEGMNAGAWDNEMRLGLVSSANFSSMLNNVWYGCPYYYRTYATNASGEAWANSSTNFFSLSPGSNLFSIVDAGFDSITPSSAVVNATYAGPGALFEVFVYYGTSDGDTNAITWSNVMEVASLTNVASSNLSLMLTGLVDSATHFYRFRMTNCFEDIWSPVTAVFNTEGPPVVDNAGGASGIGREVATINGTLTSGGVANVSFYWGPNDGGTSKSNWANQVDLGSMLEGSFSQMLSGLTFGVQYFYRTYATNQLGEAWATTSHTFKVTPPTASFADGYRVQQGEMLMTAVTADQTIENVKSLSNAFVILHYFYGHRVGGPETNPNVGMTSAYLWDDNGVHKIRFTRNNAAQNITVSWTVVEALDEQFTVYRGSFAHSQAGSNTMFTTGIGATVDGSRSLAWVNGTTFNQGNRDNCGLAYFTAEVNGISSNLVLRRDEDMAVGSGVLRWMVAEFDLNKIGGFDSGTETLTGSEGEGARYTFPINDCVKSRSILIGQERSNRSESLGAFANAYRIADDTTGELYVWVDGTPFVRNVRWYCIDFGPAVGGRQEGQIGVINFTTIDQPLSPSVDSRRAWSFASSAMTGTGNAYPR
ncbi:MAG: hypothetical protein AAF492_10510, partial [Verrucomicrobiota bacterium]